MQPYRMPLSSRPLAAAMALLSTLLVGTVLGEEWEKLPHGTHGKTAAPLSGSADDDSAAPRIGEPQTSPPRTSPPQNSPSRNSQPPTLRPETGHPHEPFLGRMTPIAIAVNGFVVGVLFATFLVFTMLFMIARSAHWRRLVVLLMSPEEAEPPTTTQLRTTRRPPSGMFADIVQQNMSLRRETT